MVDLEEAKTLLDSIRILRNNRRKEKHDLELSRYQYALTSLEMLLESLDDTAERHLVDNARSTLRAALQLNNHRNNGKPEA